jgi:hypothetical protein
MLLVILVTSVLMFSQKHNDTISIVHTIIGFFFLTFALWHLVNNFGSLKRYINPKNLLIKSPLFGITLPISLVFSLVLLVLVLFQMEPFKSFYRWGTTLRVADVGGEVEKDVLQYQVFNFGDKQLGRRDIRVEFKKGGAFMWPQYAIWIESIDGAFVQPVYVTDSIATNTFKNTVWLKDTSKVLDYNPLKTEGVKFWDIFSKKTDENASNNRSRKESLPVFLHKLKSDTSKLINEEEMAILDGFTGATITDNFIISQKLKNNDLSVFNVYLEINQSFDFNQYYSSDRFPDDPVYSGDGFSAQPSVIYRAHVDLDSGSNIYPMILVGHGHHSGGDGLIDTDMSNITTALDLVDRVLVDVK